MTTRSLGPSGASIGRPEHSGGTLGWRESELPEVTVCVPAYRSAAFIGQTLSAIRDQTFTDFAVEIAIEPQDADATMRACLPFVADERFRVHRNTATLGWAGNIRSLLTRVVTPYYLVVPHDDIVHPDYLDVLLGILRSRPDASVAYGDLYLFGNVSGSRRFVLPDAPLGERLLAFFLAGAEGTPWHGVTRRSVLEQEFHVNEFNSFAVECEWSLHIVSQGVALRAPRPLYFKRDLHLQNVSWLWRAAMPQETLRGALDHHRTQMLSGIPREGIPADLRRAIELAAEAATLRRWVLFSNGKINLSQDRLEAAAHIATDAVAEAVPRASEIAASARLALSQYWSARGEPDRSQDLASAAVRDWPDLAEAWIQLGRLALARHDVHEAAHMAAEARQHDADGITATLLEAACHRALDARFPWPAQ